MALSFKEFQAQRAQGKTLDQLIREGNLGTARQPETNTITSGQGAAHKAAAQEALKSGGTVIDHLVQTAYPNAIAPTEFAAQTPKATNAGVASKISKLAPVATPNLEDLQRQLTANEAARVENSRQFENVGVDNYTALETERKQLEAERQRLNNQIADMGGEADYSFGERAKNTVAGWARGQGAAYTGALATAVGLGNALQESSSEIDRAINDSEYSGWVTDDLTRANFEQSLPQSAGILEENKDIQNQLEETAKNLGLQSATDLSRAKAGASKLGQFAIDSAVGALDVAGDTVLSMATGGLGTAAMATRAFGSAANQARENGASTEEQALFGAATAAVEILSEKLLGMPFAKAYGKGITDDAVQNLVARWFKTDAGRTVGRLIANGIGEGGEEFVSAVLGPALEAIYDKGGAAKKSYLTADGILDLAKDALYQAAVGGALGFAGGASNIVTGENARQNADLRLRESASKILNDPAQRAAWEAEHGKTLPEKFTDAIDEIIRTESEASKAAQPAAAQKQAEKPVIDQLLEQKQSPAPQTNTAGEQSIIQQLISRGTVSNSQAEAIIANPQLISALEAAIPGLDLSGTKSQKRAAIKSAVAEAHQNAAETQTQQGDIPAPPESANEPASPAVELNTQETQAATEQQAAEQKNTAPDGTESTAVNTDPSRHTPVEQAVIDEYQNAVDDNLVSYIEMVRDNPGANVGRYRLKPVSDRAANDIKRLTGVDVAGNKTAIEPRMVEHILKDHGENGESDRSMRDVNDIARIQYVLDNYDSVRFGGSSKAYVTQKPNGKHGLAKTVVFSKAVNGTYYVVEAVPDTKAKTVFVVTAYMSNKITGDMRSADAEAWRVTSETKGAQSPVTEANASMGNITQDGGNGNTPGQKRSKTESHTLQAMAEQAGVEQEPIYYTPDTEQASMQEATQRVASGIEAEKAKLSAKEMWDNREQDTALLISSKLMAEAAETGDYSKVSEWGKIVSAHIGETARALQATKKWTRSGAAIATDGVAALEEAANISPEKKQSGMDALNRFGTELDRISNAVRARNDASEENASGFGKATAEDKAALRKLILDMSAYRGTGTFKKGNFGKLLTKIDDFDWLQEYATRQLMAVPADLIAPETRTLSEKLKTQQVLSQLTSIATFSRNLLGNVTFDGIDTLTQDGFGVALDRLISLYTGKKTVAVDKGWFSSEARKQAADAFTKSVLEVAGDIDMRGDGGNQYGITTGRTYKMSGNAVERVMSRWEQLLSYSLNVTDRLSRGRIEGAQKESLDRITDSGLTEKEKQTIAENTADYRLFQNDGTAAKMSKGIHDILNLVGAGGKIGPGGRQGGFGLGDLLNAYPRVPANLGVKALEYSPANIVKGGIELIKVLKDAKAGKLDAAKQNQTVMDIARGMAGTPIVALCAALVKSGLIKNFDDEEDYNVMAQNAAEGKTGTQINLSGALRYLSGQPAEWRDGDDLMSIGWLQPVNSFLTTGALVADLDEDAAFGDYAKAYATGAIQSFLDMPVMSNVANLVDTLRYSDAEDLAGKAIEGGTEFLLNNATGFIPAPVRQLAKALDPYYRETSGDTTLETAWNNLANSIPGLRQTLDIKTDTLGQAKENSGGFVQRLLNAAVLPGAVTEINQSEVSAELDRLYSETGVAGVYPDRKAPKSIKHEGEQLALTSGEKQTFHQTASDISNRLIAQALQSDAYKSAPDAVKADIVDKLNSYGIDRAKKELVESRGETYKSDWDDEAELDDPVAYLSAKAVASEAMKDDNEWNYNAINALLKSVYPTLDEASKELLDSGKTANLDKMAEAAANGMDAETWKAMYDKFKSVNENEILSAAQKATAYAAWVDTQNISERQKQVIKNTLKFSSGFTVAAEKYEELRSAGLSSEASETLYNVMSELPILPGHGSVLQSQKVEAIARAGYLSEDEKWAIIGVYVSDAAYKKAMSAKANGYTFAQWAAEYTK